MMEFNFFKLLLLSVLSTHILSHEVQHQRTCLHDKYVEPELIEMMKMHHNTPKRTQRLVNGLSPDGEIYKPKSNRIDNPQPFRIKPDFQLGNISQEQEFFIKDILMPIVIQYFEKIFYVRRPVEGKLHLPYSCKSYFTDYPDYCVTVHETCGPATLNPEYMSDLRLCDAPFEEDCVTTPGGPGAEDADFILYVTSSNDLTCSTSSSAVGSGGFCLLDDDNWYGSLNRPLAGYANLCPKQLSTDPDTFGDLLDTTVHEVFHSLLMSHELMNNFVDENNNLLKDAVLEGPIGLYVASPAVVRSVQSMFDCDSLPGAALEDDGGDGTANSHWERRQFLGELMVGNSVSSTRDVISEVTLALAEDSGWYLPNYKYAGIIPEIHHNGCGYIYDDCAKPSQALEDIFCWPDKVDSDNLSICTYDHTAVGYCNSEITLLGDDCSLVLPYSNMECNNPEHGSSSSIDIGTRNQFGARCFPVSSTNLYRTDGKYIVWVTGPIGATCFDTVCHDNKLYLNFEATDYNPAAEVACPSGEYVDLTKEGIGYTEGVIGPCPDNDSVCNAWGCPNDCNLKGDCFKGRCYCHVGFFGKDCSSYSCDSDKICIDPGTACDPVLKICVPETTLIDYDLVLSYHEDIVKATTLTESTSTSKEVEETKESAVYYPDLISYQIPYKTIEEENQVYIGTAANNGYYAFCEVYVLKRNSAVKEKNPSVVKTDLLGGWEFIYNNEGFAFVDSHTGENCIDMLSGASIRWSLRAPLEVQYITPVTSLGSIKDKDEFWTKNGYQFDSKILKGLEIDDQKILFEDSLKKVYTGGTGYERRLLALSLIINNIVAQVGAFETGKMNKLDVIAYDILYALRSLIRENSFAVSKFKDASVMEGLIKNVDANSNSDIRKELGNVLAEINKIALDLADEYSGSDLLVRLGALSYLTEEYLVPDASRMSNFALNLNEDEFFIMFKNVDLRKLVEDNVKPLNKDFINAMQNENNKSEISTSSELNNSSMAQSSILMILTIIIISMVIMVFIIYKRKENTMNDVTERLINGN